MKNLLNLGMLIFFAITIFSSCTEEEIIPVVETTITSDNARAPISLVCDFTTTLEFWDAPLPWEPALNPLKFPHKLQVVFDNCPKPAPVFFPWNGLCDDELGFAFGSTNVTGNIILNDDLIWEIIPEEQEEVWKNIWLDAQAVFRPENTFVSRIEIIWTNVDATSNYFIEYRIYYAYASDSPLCQ